MTSRLAFWTLGTAKDQFSTPNAPDFTFLAEFRMFSHFPFLTFKIAGLLLVHLSNTLHRLKPLVILVRREVPFLTHSP